MNPFRQFFNPRTALLGVLSVMLTLSTFTWMDVKAAENHPSSEPVSKNSFVYPAPRPLSVDNISEPAVTMTTKKAIGGELEFTIGGFNINVDYGDGVIEDYYQSDQKVKGQIIKLYGDITYLECDKNLLTELIVSNCPKLSILHCSCNQLTSLDLSHNTALENLSCMNNKLTSLDLSNNNSLISLQIEQNSLYYIDVSQNVSLDYLFCGSNHLTTLDVSHNPALTELDCNGNQLTSIDVSHNPALTVLDCSSNQLTSIDVSHNPDLLKLSCKYNQLTSLDLSNNAKLSELTCFNNQLTSLDLSNNAKLSELICSNNNISLTDIAKIDMESIRNNFTNDEVPGKCIYVPQYFQLPETVSAGEKIDLSSINCVKGTPCEFRWIDESRNEILPATAEGGVFTFSENDVGKRIFCLITNQALPESDFIEGWYEAYGKEQMQTTKIAIIPDKTIEGYKTIKVDPNPYVYQAELIEEATLISKAIEISTKQASLTATDISTPDKDTIINTINDMKPGFNVVENNIAAFSLLLKTNQNNLAFISNGNIKVCLRYPESVKGKREKYTFKLYHQKANYSLEELPIICNSDGIWFETNTCEGYILVWGRSSNGPLIILITVAGIIVVLSAALAVLLVLRRKKRISSETKQNKQMNN